MWNKYDAINQLVAMCIKDSRLNQPTKYTLNSKNSAPQRGRLKPDDILVCYHVPQSLTPCEVRTYLTNAVKTALGCA